jgi:hypothetical protein
MHLQLQVAYDKIAGFERLKLVSVDGRVQWYRGIGKARANTVTRGCSVKSTIGY